MRYGFSQKVNIQKLGFFFGRNKASNTKLCLKEFIRIEYLRANVKYLGIPLFLTRSKNGDFRFLIKKA